MDSHQLDAVKFYIQRIHQNLSKKIYLKMIFYLFKKRSILFWIVERRVEWKPSVINLNLIKVDLLNWIKCTHKQFKWSSVQPGLASINN